MVTGASRGIGAAVATLAGERGYAVAVNFATGKAGASRVVDEIVAKGGRAVQIQAMFPMRRRSFISSIRPSGSWVQSRAS